MMRLMLRTGLLVLAVSCRAAGPTVTQSPIGPAPASSAGTPTPWPTVAVIPAPALRTQTRPLPHDLAQLRGLAGVTISPDGARVAYVVRWSTFDPKAKPAPDDKPDEDKAGWKVEQQLFVVARTGGTPRQLTFGDEPVSSPRFSPDGKQLAFLRKKGPRPALHVLDLAGGEPRVIPSGDHDIGGFAWAPDGKAFAFTAQRPLSEDEKTARWRRGGARRHEDWKQNHLFVLPLAGGEARHVNRGTDSVVSFAWSPDGKRFALVLAKSSDPVDSFQKLVLVSARDGDNAQELDRGDGKASFLIAKVEWSPDSRRVAYTLTSRGGLSHYDELRVHDGTRAIDIAAKLDLELTGFVWAADSRSVVASTIARTFTKLYRLPITGRGAKEIVLEKRSLFGLEGDRSGRFLVAASSTPTAPADPTVIDVERRTATAVATINPQVSEWTIARNEIVRWKNREGIALDGVLTITSHAKAGTPPPLLVLPHGGPDSVSLETFSSWAQFFAARGYSVFEPNYRGGTGYGRPHYEANRGRLGEIELADIESGVDSLIAAGKADPKRLFYSGWSWGGYLSAYTLGHTDRYRAFMVGAGVVDVVVQYVTSDINHGPAADWEFKGRPWTQPEAFTRSNPAPALVNAKAPTLVIHGENDDRVPFINGLILYRALADRGIPVELWAYPREPHGFKEPAHLQHLYETWAAFLDKHDQ
jgi:dipeptidyl aminopeptidase/acylaminoacyl peptidase